ncbi:type III-B CRISPR module RAMP protein Cmr6 [Allochromatium vinosum]|uniref:type III-B CRISPR module RAMP protein Cmr6 n=1 Tax=Allochromatium vinosum TaxID=1049 RepID=UPI001905BF35|nr:type III-B CRISPR module RAMP protein Cmr6 [Allochromatium vinosum]MBK1656455.1 type III-B CRISPR module RAMP protein Cmr6 [Allochromatium vinosum]
MNWPLYCDHQAPNAMPDGGHRGLWYERFFNAYDDGWTLKDDRKAQWVKSNAKSAGDGASLQEAVQRHLELVTKLGGRGAVFQADWHFATGLGLPHPVENGLTWHHTLGVPYLAGSAVKGLLRAWVEVWDEAVDDEARQRRLDTWFGTLEQAGAFIFFDALPIEPVSLRADVMTPHMGKWYEQGGEIEDWRREPDRVPADWHAPVPVPFLVAGKPRLLFGIAPRHPDGAAELPEVFKALKQALDWLGAGAKTAVGYGQMQEDPASTEDLQHKRREKAEQEALSALSPEQQTLRRLQVQLDDYRQRNIKPEAGSAFMGETRQCLDAGREWPAPERAKLATLIESIYSYAGWGSGDKKRQRKDLVERLRN